MTTPLDPSELIAAGASACAQALADRHVRAALLCDTAIARIEQRDGAINAVVVRDFDRARAQARAADAALARGERQPLLGVPMTVKESFNIAGLKTTWGILPFKDFVASEDAVVVQRLKAAGAVILGKTNVPPGLGDWQTNNPIHGRTVHPLDATRTPGGSSGGAAAALCAGMVALEVGSDIGGSIRMPAAFCGVYGHKPSHGLVPTRGHDVPTMATGAPDTLSVVGPLARSADDLLLALNVLAGPDTPDAAAYRLSLPAPRAAAWRDWRVLVIDSHPMAPASAQVRGAVNRLAAQLEDAGAHVARQSALLPDLKKVHEVYEAMLLTIVSQGDPQRKGTLSAYDWLALHHRRAGFQRQWAALFSQFDAVIFPAFGVVPFIHDDLPDMEARTLMIDGEPTPYVAQLAWAGMASLAGLPATAAPIGQTESGLPLGVQIVGGYLQDRTTIALAQALAGLGST
ncbi:amidase family protein [Variovorax sp. H27-G14]|uniref:amidase family protein n=1 Tax=Variovorax sp. H27-G14 TaxID=3111914 RepID=UPI0038FCDC49